MYVYRKEKEKNINLKEINAGRVFYENCCMKAVNQSIGKIILHHLFFLL